MVDGDPSYTGQVGADGGASITTTTTMSGPRKRVYGSVRRHDAHTAVCIVCNVQIPQFVECNAAR